MKGPAEGETTYSVVVIACDEPHDREVYALFDLTGSEFPGAEPVTQEGLEGCVARFADYVGTSFETSELDAISLTPTAESWELGDRSVVCLTMLIGDDTQLEGSVRQSGR